MAAFNEKKEHDLSGKRGPARKGKQTGGDRKASKSQEPKVNGSGDETKVETENGVEKDTAETEETTES
jgi:hypothetical protein